ncbi:hypothetical protein V7S43_010438 [Phytophthora oleae]|uniref:Uncharacterized protein n=1 Tax=Phytophthora oleae TaxID=2107226 RepID=A0ABD3FGM7_9STRA
MATGRTDVFLDRDGPEDHDALATDKSSKYHSCLESFDFLLASVRSTSSVSLRPRTPSPPPSEWMTSSLPSTISAASAVSAR